jgi:hypothetical protein
MDLAAHQRKLLALFKSTYQPDANDDAYIQRVAQSRDLEEGRRNISLWRVFVLERTCALTFRLLKHKNLLQETLAAFIAGNNISPFRETQAPAFLEAAGNHPDRLISSVARFELALMKVRQGDPGTYVIDWAVQPHTVLHSLAKDVPLPDDIPAGSFQTVISSAIPGDLRIFSLPSTAATSRQ